MHNFDWRGLLLALALGAAISAFFLCLATITHADDCLAWCERENRADFRGAKDECQADYYSERAYCYDTLDTDAEHQQCRDLARLERSRCVHTVRQERVAEDALCPVWCR